MSSYINEAKVVIHRLIGRLSRVFQNFAFRASFVGYRDIEDGHDRTTVFNFDSNADSFKRFVNNVTAKGGHDQCEDIFGGLEEVTKLDWTHPTKILFHIGDAPCHGNRFHNSCYDSHPSGDPRGLNLTNLLQIFVDKNINYYFAEINSSTFKMIDEFNKELRMIYGNEIKTVKLNNVKDLEMLATQSVTKSICDTKSASMHSLTGSGKQKKKIRTDKIALKWSPVNFKKLKAELYSAKLEGDINDIKSNKISFIPEKVEIELCETPFGKGSNRYAYAAYLIKNEKKTKYVLKESQFQSPESNSMTFFQNMIETQLFAIQLADLFSKESKSTRSLEFIDVNIIMLTESGKYYSIEKFLEGEFIKYNNNGEYVNEEKYTCTLNAFSHWSYQSTNEYLLVADLQGFFILEKDKFLLTDPAIACAKDPLRFGSTNLGQKGIKVFFSKHRCNHICKSLNLKKHKYQILPDLKTDDTGTVLKA